MRADRLSLLFTYLVSGLGAGAALLHAAPSFAFLQLVFIGLGAAWDLRERHPISPWMLTTATVIGLLVAIALPNANGPVGRLMSAAVVLMGGKLLAPKANRDHLQIMVLSLILLVGAAILSVNLAFAVLFAAYLLLTTLALVWLPFGATMRTRRVERGLLLRLGGVGLGLVIGALPLLVFFFAGLPRTDVPFLRGVAPAASQVSGFSNQVTLGDVGRIAQSRQVAFRAEILDRKGPLPSAPYWRGLVLEVTDGISWTARPADLLGDPVRRPGAPAPTNTVAQLVYLEPHGLTDLFGLDRPLQVTLPSPWETRVQDAAAQAPRPLNRRIRYEVISDLDDAWPVALPPAQRALDLELPAGLPPVLAQRAQEIVGAETNAYRKAESILAYFHSGEFHYAVSGLGEGQGHPLSVFLEQTKTGYCELFASSMALMLRRVGVPARMVAGYLGGDFNPTGNYYLVRQLSAHVWVEAYIDGRGWVRFDPTPPSEGPASPAAAGEGPSGLSLTMDALRLKWQALVLGYDLDAQTGLLQRMADGVGHLTAWRPGLSGPADLAVTALLAAALVAGIVIWRRPVRENVAEVTYVRLLRRLRRRGLERSPAEGPCDFAERAAAALPDKADGIRTVTESYVLARYGRRRLSPDEVRTLRETVRRI